jgi:predicted Zn-dependent protease
MRNFLPTLIVSRCQRTTRERDAIDSLAAALCAFALCLTPSTAALAFSFQPTPLQFALLPDHCKARLVDFYAHREGSWKHKFPINETRITRYRKLIGPDYAHMHHYCAGLAHLARANEKPRNSHNAFRVAKGEISYTLSRSNPQQPLWIEMSIAHAKAAAGLGEVDAALAELRALLKLAPDNEVIYLAIAQIQKRAGAINDAINTLEEGLRQNGKPGPLLFFLAQYHADLGDITEARTLAQKAEAAGMKMDRLKKRLAID